jgi:protein gp37
MGTSIEWTDETWNPIRARLRSDPSVVGWHCEHASPGCLNCYSEARNRSGRCNLGTKLAFKPGHRKDVELFLDESALAKPLGWRNSVEQVRAVLAAGKAIVDGPAASHSTTDRSPHA